MDIKEFILDIDQSGREALRKLDTLGVSGSVLFICDSDKKLIGSLTDGDIRRGLLKNLGIDDTVSLFMKPNPHTLFENKYGKDDVKKLRELGIRFAPILSENKLVIKIIDTQKIISYLPIDALIMAGGRGERLMPLTQNVPKPMLKVGNKPIIEYNIDRLIQYGINNITISIRYLGDQLIDYFGDGSSKGAKISYVTETQPMGTIGALVKMENILHDYVLVMNSDLLTNIDFEDLFETLLSKNGDMIVASTPYIVNIPFAVLELNSDFEIKDFKEKPKYTYYSNAGIYIIKKEMIQYIPQNQKFDATDLMALLIAKNKKLVSEPILGYWLDIGRMEDLKKAQEDIKHLNI